MKKRKMKNVNFNIEEEMIANDKIFIISKHRACGINLVLMTTP